MSASKQPEIIQLDDDKPQTTQNQPAADSTPTKAKPSINPDEFPKISSILKQRAEKRQPIDIAESPPLNAAIPLPIQPEKITPDVKQVSSVSQPQPITVVEDLKGLKMPDLMDEFRKRCEQALQKKKLALNEAVQESEKKEKEKVNFEEVKYAVSSEAIPLPASESPFAAQTEMIPEAAVKPEEKKAEETLSTEVKDFKQSENIDQPIIEEQPKEIKQKPKEFLSQNKEFRQIVEENVMVPEVRNENEPQSMDVEAPPSQLQSQFEPQPVVPHLSNTLSAPSAQLHERTYSAPQFEQEKKSVQEIPQISANIQEEKPSSEKVDNHEEQASKKPEQKAPQKPQQQKPEDQLSAQDLDVIKKKILMLLPHEAEKVERNGLEAIKQMYWEIKKDMGIDLRIETFKPETEDLPKQTHAQVPAQKQKSAIEKQQKQKPIEIMDLDASLEGQNIGNIQQPQPVSSEQQKIQQPPVVRERRYSFGKGSQIDLDAEPENNQIDDKKKDDIIAEKVVEKPQVQETAQQTQKPQQNAVSELNGSDINKVRVLLMKRMPDMADQINLLQDQQLKDLLDVINKPSKESSDKQKGNNPKDHEYEKILNECIRLKPEMADELRKMSPEKVRQIYEECKRKPLMPAKTNVEPQAIQVDNQIQEKPQQAIQKEKEPLKPSGKRVTIIEPEDRPQAKRSHEQMMETNQRKPQNFEERKKRVFTVSEVRTKLRSKLPQLAEHIGKLNDSEIMSIWEESVEKNINSDKTGQKTNVILTTKDATHLNGKTGILKGGQNVRVFENVDEKRQKKTRTIVMVQSQFDCSEHDTRQTRARAEEGKIVKKCNCECCRKMDVNDLLRRLADLIEQKK